MIFPESALWHGEKIILAVRYIKSHDNQLRQDAIANIICDDSDVKFWKEINKNLISYFKFDPNLVISPWKIEDTINKLVGVN